MTHPEQDDEESDRRMSEREDVEALAEDDGPECETCGKTDCPDADLPAFSEPRACIYKPVYDALRDARNCDYGCARDYTNQSVRFEVVGAVERIVAAHVEAVRVSERVRLAGEVEALADRWAGVLAECKQADPRWILVMALGAALNDLRATLRAALVPVPGVRLTEEA